MADQLDVRPGDVVLFRPEAPHVLGSNVPFADEDLFYPLLISSINWSRDENGQHVEDTYDSINGTAFIEGVPMVVHNVPAGNVQGSFTSREKYGKPPVVESTGANAVPVGPRGAVDAAPAGVDSPGDAGAIGSPFASGSDI